MLWFSLAVAVLISLGIMWIGFGYLTNPKTMAPSFGLRLPLDDAKTWWWLRLKGVRDITSGVLVLAFVAAGAHRPLGIILLVEALIPFGDMSVVLAGQGRRGTALGAHGATAFVMVLGAVPLLIGGY